MQRNKSFEPVLEKAMMDGVITIEEKIKIKDQIMIQMHSSYGNVRVTLFITLKHI